jgi:hypothetical protein
MDVAADAMLLGQAFKPGTVISFAHRGELQLWPACQQSRQCGNERVHPFVAFSGDPPADREHHPTLGKIRWQHSPRRGIEHRFEVWVERPRQNPNARARRMLLHRNLVGCITARREHHIRAPQR